MRIYGAVGLSEGLAKADINVLPIQDGELRIWTNESILRQPTDQILEALLVQDLTWCRLSSLGLAGRILRDV